MNREQEQKLVDPQVISLSQTHQHIHIRLYTIMHIFAHNYIARLRLVIPPEVHHGSAFQMYLTGI